MSRVQEKSAPKPKLVFVIGHDAIVRNFIDTNVLEEASLHYDIIYLCSHALTKVPAVSCSFNVDLKSKQNTFLNKVDFYLWYLAYFKYIRKAGDMKEGLRCSFKASTLTLRMKNLLVFLSLPLIYELVMWFFDRVVLKPNRDMIKILKSIRPAAIIVPGLTFDSFGMQAIRAAHGLKIETVMVVAHWDYLSRKGILRIVPDHLCVWGKQMQQLAVNFHKIPSAKITILGVPHFQTYLDYQRKSIVGSDPRPKQLLFAGAGVTYDELTPLKMLDQAVDGLLPAGTKIIYRAHPKQHPRKCEYLFNPRDFKNVSIDPQDNSRVNGKNSYAAMEYYVDLLHKIDGLITPLSTMLIEAALCGKPSLIIAFSDGIHDWDFENNLKAEHISGLAQFEWIVVCSNKEELIEKFKLFTQIMNIPNIAKKIKQEIMDVVYYDSNSYQTRLALFLKDHLLKNIS